MSTQFESAAPFIRPTIQGDRPAQREQAPASLLAAGMAMIAVSGLGLVYALFSFAFSFGEVHVDPNAPEMVRRIQEGTVGPVATGIQGGFAMLNLFVIICGVQMMKLKSWGMGVAGAVLSMLNFGGCCCVLGIPVGIWSLMVLMSPDVISMFSTAQSES